MGSLEKLVEGAFRGLLICSAIYFGAKYSTYVLKIADNIKEKIMHGADMPTSTNSATKYRDPPESLRYSDPKLYNAILIDNYLSRNSYEQTSKFDNSPITYERK